MLSQTEIDKIKTGVRMIKSQQPQATVDMVYNTFYMVFGKGLSDEELLEAKELITKEFYGPLN